ncbi:MAG: MFS transporter [Anaerolineae bacterium]|nr:MFS transporter [Anaerolineae bacterium]
MKNRHLQQPPFQNNFSTVGSGEIISTTDNHAILVSLMVPVVMVIMNLTMFNIALPTIRDLYHIQAEVAAWMVTVYTIPFMVSMPLYGRLGDELGKRRLFFVGIAIFMIGTIVVLTANTLSQLMVGRAIQGVGSSGVVPLCMAIISQIFPPAERGRALGTWNSIGPVTGIVGPFIAGLLIDYLSWRTIFGPILVAGLAGAVVVQGKVPQEQKVVHFHALRSFDWLGVALLGLGVTTTVFYLSSQVITGVASLQDWRLLILAIVFFCAFIVWEKRHKDPYIALSIFSNTTFSRASVCSAIRMFAMSSVGFLVPLYLTDVYNLSASLTGIILMLHAGALLGTMRLGGQLADRWSSRRPVLSGMSVQMVTMVLMAVLSVSTPVGLVLIVIIFHGLGAGLSLAALHRASMSKIPREQTGTAAGVYSMVRFGGNVLGPTVGGVILQHGLDQSLLPIEAYHIVFWCICGVMICGVLIGWKLYE